VVSVDLNVNGQQVVGAVDAGRGPFRYPGCQQETAGYDRKTGRWRHLDT